MKKFYPVRNNDKRNNKYFNDYVFFSKDEELDLESIDTSILDAWRESVESENYDMGDWDYFSIK